MDLLLAPIVELYRTIQTPIAPFTWFGLPLSTLDIAGTVRLCVIMRQLKEMMRADHERKRLSARRALKGKDKAREAGVVSSYDDEGDAGDDVLSLAATMPRAQEERSFVRDALGTLLVVYGGEIVCAPFLGQKPSFMYSGMVPILFILTQAAVERLPSVPVMSFATEGPLSIFDAINRATLLCNFIPPSVTKNSDPALANSPWTMLLTSLMMANSGFMLMGTFSFLSPTALSFTTPTEFLPYGWTTMDIWAAPLITGLYSMLTHAQPFWATTHAFLATALGVAPTVPGGSTPPYGEKSGEMKDPSGLPQSPAVAPVDAETARAACALLLMVMFAGRTTRNFGGVKVIQGWLGQAKDPQARLKKTQ